MPYGEIRVDTITFTNGGVDKSITVSGLFASTSGNLTVTGTVSGVTATFATGTFSSRVSGLTVVGTTGTFTSLTGTTITGANASFVSGVFTNQISGATVTGTTANFTSGNITALNVAGQIRIDNNTTDPNDGSSYLFQTSGIGWTIASTNVSINTGASGSRQERLRIDSSGRVGIGTSSPSAILHTQVSSAGVVYRGIHNNTGLDVYVDDSTGETRITAKRIGGTGGKFLSFYTDTGSAESERLRIDSSGRVGIGTSSPSEPLSISASSNAFISITNSTAAKTNYIGTNSSGDLDLNGNGSQIILFKTAGTERLRIDSSGRLGIGTSSPGYLLDVNGGGTIPAQFGATVNWNYAGLLLRRNASNISTAKMLGMLLQGDTDGDTTLTNHLNIWGTYSGTPTTGSTTAGLSGVMNLGAPSGIALHVNGSQRAVIDSSGNLLVGLSNSVTIVSALSKQQIFSTNQHAFSWLRGSNDSGGVNVLLAKSRNASPGSRTILQNNDEVGTFTFVADDGTDLESAVASIACAIDGTPGANDTPGRLVFSTTADGASSPMERMRIKNNGLVCIACTDRIDVATNASGFNYLPGDFVCVATTVNTNACAVFNKTNSAAGLVIAIRYNGVDVGSITNTSTSTAYNTSSDYRLKENVVPLTGAIDRINQLKPSQFNFIADPDRIVDGFLAHEAQEVVPECVTGEKDAVDDKGNPIYQGIDQSKMVPLAIAAIQEAIAKIKTLEAKVAALEGV